MLCFVLDLRSAPVGGAVVPARLTLGTPTLDMLQQCNDVVFLVHGFNVDRANGMAELGAFGKQLTALGEGAAVAVLWPGDSSIGPLSYPFETNKADDSAVELATFIGDELPRAPRISFIGHSLGCRVVMETVRQLWIKGIPVAQVLLMAAAIDNDSLGVSTAYQRAAQFTARTGVLYSPSDTVLRNAYPIGNLVSALLHTASTTDAALGFTGPFSSSSPPPSQVQAVGIPGAVGVNHGDYLPNAAGQFNSHQACAARFANSVLAGVTPCLRPEAAGDQMNEPQPPSGILGLPVSVWIALFLGVAGVFALSQKPFQDTRPPNTTVPLHHHAIDDGQIIEARLWEDPLSAVALARSVPEKERPKPYPLANLKSSIADYADETAILVLAVMVSGEPAATTSSPVGESATPFWRASSLGIHPANSDHIGYLDADTAGISGTKPCGGAEDKAPADNEASGDHDIAAFEWFKRDKAETGKPPQPAAGPHEAADLTRSDHALVLWLDQEGFRHQPQCTLSMFLKPIMGETHELADLAVLGPADSDGLRNV